MLMQWRKQRARAAALKRRAAAHAGDPEAGRRLADHFPDCLWPKLHSVVAGYYAVRSEIDPAPLMETFWCEQARLALPCVTAPDAPLEFRAWAPGGRVGNRRLFHRLSAAARAGPDTRSRARPPAGL